MRTEHRQVTSTSPEQTEGLARALAVRLSVGDVVLLDGPVGAGKSHFARSAILALLAAPEDVPSPTYTLVQTYYGRQGEIWHADLYRLGDTSEIHELGLVAAFEDAICLVEWPDRLGPDRPKQALTLTVQPQQDEETRALQFSWTDPKWNARLEEVIGDRSFVA